MSIQNGIYSSGTLAANPIEAPAAFVAQSEVDVYPIATNRPDDSVDNRAHFLGCVSGKQRFSIRTRTDGGVNKLELWMGDYEAGTAVCALTLDDAGNLTIPGKLTQG